MVLLKEKRQREKNLHDFQKEVIEFEKKKMKFEIEKFEFEKQKMIIEKESLLTSGKKSVVLDQINLLDDLDSSEEA